MVDSDEAEEEDEEYSEEEDEEGKDWEELEEEAKQCVPPSLCTYPQTKQPMNTCTSENQAGSLACNLCLLLLCPCVLPNHSLPTFYCFPSTPFLYYMSLDSLSPVNVWYILGKLQLLTYTARDSNNEYLGPGG